MYYIVAVFVVPIVFFILWLYCRERAQKKLAEALAGKNLYNQCYYLLENRDTVNAYFFYLRKSLQYLANAKLCVAAKSVAETYKRNGDFSFDNFDYQALVVFYGSTSLEFPAAGEIFRTALNTELQNLFQMEGYGDMRFRIDSKYAGFNNPLGNLLYAVETLEALQKVCGRGLKDLANITDLAIERYNELLVYEECERWICGSQSLHKCSRNKIAALKSKMKPSGKKYEEVSVCLASLDNQGIEASMLSFFPQKITIAP